MMQEVYSFYYMCRKYEPHDLLGGRLIKMQEYAG